MFTGIITDVGEVLWVRDEGDWRARIATHYDMTKVAIGASIASDGVCLTVIAFGEMQDDPRHWYEVQISAETLTKTNLGHWSAGRRVNLERALKVGDELGGHIVSGHVDGLAEVIAVRNEGQSVRITFRTSGGLGKYIAPKGSVVLNGTSLTVNDVVGPDFGINLIPHTQSVTNWDEIALGNQINLEVDLMARYMDRLQDWRLGNNDEGLAEQG